MGIAERATEAYKVIKKAKKVKKYSTLVLEAVDEATRPGALLKLGVEGIAEITSKVTSLKVFGPYVKYHKIHVAALAKAMNAVSNKEAAMKALHQAVSAADGAKALTDMLTDFKQRKEGLKLYYGVFLADSLAAFRAKADAAVDDAATTAIKLGNGNQLLTGGVFLGKLLLSAAASDGTAQVEGSDVHISDVTAGLEAWRASWCELYLDGVQLLAMAQVEQRMTEAAMANYGKVMKKMESGGSVGQIAAKSTEQDRMWEQFDRMTAPGGGDAKAVEDPAGYAASQVAKVQEMVSVLGECCEFVMSDDAIDESKVNTSIGSM